MNRAHAALATGAAVAAALAAAGCGVRLHLDDAERCGPPPALEAPLPIDLEILGLYPLRWDRHPIANPAEELAVRLREAGVAASVRTVGALDPEGRGRVVRVETSATLVADGHETYNLAMMLAQRATFMVFYPLFVQDADYTVTATIRYPDADPDGTEIEARSHVDVDWWMYSSEAEALHVRAARAATTCAFNRLAAAAREGLVERFATAAPISPRTDPPDEIPALHADGPPPGDGPPL